MVRPLGLGATGLLDHRSTPLERGTLKMVCARSHFGHYVGSEVTPPYLMSLISMFSNSLSVDQTTVTVCQPRVTVIVSPIESVELDDSTVLMGENESGGVSKTDAPEIDVNAVPATGVEEAIIVVGIGGV